VTVIAEIIHHAALRVVKYNQYSMIRSLKSDKPGTDERSSRSTGRSRWQVRYLIPVVVCYHLLAGARCRTSSQCAGRSSRRSTADHRQWTGPCCPVSNGEWFPCDLTVLHGRTLQRSLITITSLFLVKSR